MSKSQHYEEVSDFEVRMSYVKTGATKRCIYHYFGKDLFIGLLPNDSENISFVRRQSACERRLGHRAWTHGHPFRSGL